MIDKRAFKGKGAADWLMEANRAYRKIIDDMDELAETSRIKTGSPWYLYKHYRSVNEQYFLMWRSYGGQHAHLRWESMVPMLERMSEDEREWYVQINDAVRLLNAKERAGRGVVRVAKYLLEGRLKEL